MKFLKTLLIKGLNVYFLIESYYDVTWFGSEQYRMILCQTTDDRSLFDLKNSQAIALIQHSRNKTTILMGE